MGTLASAEVSLDNVVSKVSKFKYESIGPMLGQRVHLL